MRDHKSLLAWQEARAVTKGVLRLSFLSWQPHLAAIFSQLQRASVSVQVNIAEGYGFGPSARMCNHFRIAYASAIETCDLLELLSELELLGGETTVDLIKHCDQCQKLLTGLLKRYSGLRYTKDKEPVV